MGPRHQRNRRWGGSIIKAVKGYLSHNSDADEEQIESTFEQLKTITQKQIGLIELAPDLDIETVTEIFIRINSKGVVLSNADFAMSKIAANEVYGGHVLRKAIDYFCHLAIAPEIFPTIRDNDPDFAATHFFQKMSWLRSENDDIYDPTYTDLLRVAFTSRFDRGRLEDLVALYLDGILRPGPMKKRSPPVRLRSWRKECWRSLMRPTSRTTL